MSVVAGLDRRFIWMGTDTFPVNLRQELHHTTLGAIRIEPYSDDTRLLNRFTNWLNQLTRSNLHKHPWTDELVHIFLLPYCT